MKNALRLVETNEIPKENRLALAEDIKNIVVAVHQQFQSGDLTVDGDLKGHHSVDEIAIDKIKEHLTTINIQANIYIEGHEPIIQGDDPEFSIYIDPVDGSLNRDLRVGNPSCVIAMSSHKESQFKDLEFGYVYDLHSGDTYYSYNDEAFYITAGQEEAIQIKCDSSVYKLEDAIAYINSGYGADFAKQEFLKTGVLRFLVKHVNGFDNTSMEICQMARGAAHLRVESRSYTDSNRKKKGSDHANLIAAMTIGKASGLYITDLEGKPLDEEMIDIDKVQDFICCSNPDLLEETVDKIRNNQLLLSESILNEFPEPTYELKETSPEQPLEIERKFLIRSLPDNLEQYPHKEIIQGYLAIVADGTEVRLRKKGDKYVQTVKGEGDEKRPEAEEEITAKQFNKFWPVTKGKRVEKTRYEIPHENGVIELDIYHGDLDGLITAEMEFDTDEDSKNFNPPSWFDEEVTKNKDYKNQSLAVHGIPKEDVAEIRQQIAEV